MNMIVSTAIAGTATPAIAAEPDPIFAAIEAHKRTYAAVNVEVVKTDEWEAAIPKEKRKTFRVDEEVFPDGVDDAERHRRYERTLEAALATHDHDDQEQHDVFQRIGRLGRQDALDQGALV